MQILHNHSVNRNFTLCQDFLDCLDFLVLKEIEVLMVHLEYLGFQDNEVNQALQG
jgi:hypothetical protein